MSSKGNILIVDDEIDIILAFKKGLESNGFLVDIYNDPVAALLNFKSDFYDLLLVDVRMPKMNALREIFPTLEVGCFIRKPIEIDDLVKRINAEIHSLDIDK
jgi:two-component system catabolic regulation response regulator CreB/two-component system response regulator ChvI